MSKAKKLLMQISNALNPDTEAKKLVDEYLVHADDLMKLIRQWGTTGLLIGSIIYNILQSLGIW